MNREFSLFRHLLSSLAESDPNLDYTPVRNEEGFITFDEFACHYIHRESDAVPTVNLYLLKGEETISTKCDSPSFVYTWSGRAWTRSQAERAVSFSSEELANECIKRLFELARENGMEP
ncbi:MAG TPA: hypothetical protein V6C97_07125 [Oculatellaceae cyanobacterium]